MRLGALLLLALLLVNATHGLVAAGQEVYAASFYAPAVSEDRTADLIRVTVEVHIPGSGSFEVDAGGRVDNTTYHSMKMAVMAASLYAGLYWGGIDVYVTLDTNRNVAGPSGSLGVAIATYLLLTRATRGYDSVGEYAITGAISPDGAASRVGAVDVKCMAAMDRGVDFIYPLVNYTEVLASECPGMPVPSMINGTLTILAAPPISSTINISLPAEFNSAMVDAARSLSEKAMNLVDTLPPDIREVVISRLNASEQVLPYSPYAAASLAFTALYNAYRGYYSIALMNGTNVYESAEREVELLYREIGGLEEVLSRSNATGSIFYIEFLSTAYTRLADAKTSINEAQGLIQAKSPLLENILLDIAIAKARIETIRAWIDTAERVRYIGPSISQDELSTVVRLYGEYAREAVLYANSILEYFIENYNVPRDILEVRINTINNLLREANQYAQEGNHVAALGFYREALSRTLSQIFGFFLARSTPDVINGYYKDLTTSLALLQLQLASKGLISGLALAYREYAEVLIDEQPATAIGLLEEAISSTIAWYTLLLESPSVGPGPGSPAALEPPIRDPLLTITVGAAAYLLALVIVSIYVVGAIRGLMRSY